MLTGCATPYLQNGVVSCYLKLLNRFCLFFFKFQFTEGKFGIPDKTDVGLLVWNKDVNVNKTLKTGSRLKTPTLPIWITCVNDNWGVLFSPNIDLMKSQSYENRY